MAVHYRNSLNKTLCVRVWSDMFYVPGRLSDDFQTLSAILFKNKVFLSTGVATSLSMLDLYENWEKPFGIYLPDMYSRSKLCDPLIGWQVYSDSITFIHPVKYKSIELRKQETFKGQCNRAVQKSYKVLIVGIEGNFKDECQGHVLRACIIIFIYRSTQEVYKKQQLKYSVWYICTLEKYKVTHLLKGLPRYRRI